MTELYLKQAGINRPVMMFDATCGCVGGSLYGDNFITWLCAGAIVGEKEKPMMTLDKNIWIVDSKESDPDFLFYLWKKSRGERFDFLIPTEEVEFLRSYYIDFGFPMMLPDLDETGKRNTRNCILL